MKKKGWLAILLAGALTLGMGVGCDKGNQGGIGQGGTGGGGQEETHTHAFAKDWSSDSEYHWHEATCGHADAVTKEQHTFQNGECTTCHYRKTDEDKIDKDTDPNAIVSDKLTEAEWKEALSEEALDNFLMYGKATSDSGNTTEMIVRVCDGNMYQKTIDGEYADEAIFLDKGEMTEAYLRTTGPNKPEEWEYFEVPSASANHHLAILRAFGDHYREAEYDSAIGAYTCTGAKLEIERGTEKDVFLLKFKGGKPCAYGDVSGNLGPISVIYGFGEAEEVVAPAMDEEIDKDTDPDTIISDKLTEAEWKEALSEKTLDNFKVYYSTYLEDTDSYTDVQSYSFVGKSWQLEQILEPSVTLQATMVVDYKDGKYEFYRMYDGQWFNQSCTEEEYGPVLWTLPGALAEEIRSLKDKFALATYDDELGAYLFTETDPSHTMYAKHEIALKFKNGKLCAFAVDHSAQPDAAFDEFCLIYGYGEAKIEPPAMDEEIDKDTDPDTIISDRLTEEEWKNALSEEALDNFQASFYQEGLTYTFSFAGENWKVECYMDGYEPMVTCIMIKFEDDFISCYQLGRYEYWERVKLTQERYDNRVWKEGVAIRLELLSLREKFSQMTYDETLGAYLFTETDETHGEFVDHRIALKFKNGKLCSIGFENRQGGFSNFVVYGYGEAEIVPPTEFQEKEAHGDDWD